MQTDDAVRNGGWGVQVVTGPAPGTISVRSKIEKGSDTRFTVWARSPDAPVEVKVRALGVEKHDSEAAKLLLPRAVPFQIGAGWTEIQLVVNIRANLEYALFAIDVGPGVTLDLDDARVEAQQWRLPAYSGGGRTVGDIPVPAAPAAPVHFTVMIHIEDPGLLSSNEAYFHEATARFTELASLLHGHDGFLTIQPEEDWPEGARTFAPDTLANLSRDYGVVYSTHTHGPKCLDAEGDPRSNNDCKTCRDCVSIETDTYPHTPDYIGELRQLLEDNSGTSVSDHNGNWTYETASDFADVGIKTWSGYKDAGTQSMYDALFTNPWRPTHCDAIETPEIFFLHDPTTEIIYIPSGGPCTAHPERLQERLGAMLAQVLSHADAERVNTFYIITHVGHFEAESDAPYIEIDPATGEATWPEDGAFAQDLAYWEATLTDLIDPLVAEGYLQWTSLPEMGELFVEWEADCANR